MHLNELNDETALAECRRILRIVSSQRRLQNRFFGCDQSPEMELDENSGWVMGMRALFRYARGEAIPGAIVQDFLDELLKLMFCGLATNTMALPPFKRMEDRPWAQAWRLSELRLAFEHETEMEVSQLAHLLGQPADVIAQKLESRGFSGTGIVPDVFVSEIYQALQESLQNSGDARS